MLKFSLIFLLWASVVEAKIYNHGYIGKAQFDIKEARFSLFDEAKNCKYELNDVHFHPKNFVMEGRPLSEIAKRAKSNCLKRILVSSLPLIEHWDGEGERPLYYTDDKSSFYWNSISDVATFEEYRRLSAEEKAQFVFLINGFLHFDMGALDAVKTTMELYKDLPIVGFGEIFGEHDIMSDQMHPRSYIDTKALDGVYELAGKKNWFVMIHNNLSHRSFKGETAAVYRKNIERVLKKHRKTLFILPHGGVMRNVVVRDLTGVLDSMLRRNDNLYVDLSFVVLENYIMAEGGVDKRWVELIEKYPERFLFGTDDLGGYKGFFDVKKYIPLLDALKPATARKVAGGNFDYLVDRALTNG